jgi:hypothetical protein
LSKIYSIVYVGLTIFSAQVAAECKDVRLETVRPIDFGKIRMLPEVSNGLVTLWPTGDFNISAGLSLSGGSEPTVGLVRVSAPSASRVELYSEIYETLNSITQNRHTIENIQFHSFETVIQEDNGRITFVTPPNTDARGATEETSVIIRISANLYIKEKINESYEIRAGIRMRCLMQK